MSDKTFYESLPQKRMAAGCILLNDKDEILLLKPTYKDSWEIPGGVVEDNESPKSCCEREVQEEIGLEIVAQRLLILDYNSYPDESHKTESLMFIFDGGIVSEKEIGAIRLNKEEISGWMFFSANNLPKETNHSLRNRILRAMEQKKNKSFAYLENQQVV